MITDELAGNLRRETTVHKIGSMKYSTRFNACYHQPISHYNISRKYDESVAEPKNTCCHGSKQHSTIAQLGDNSPQVTKPYR